MPITHEIFLTLTKASVGLSNVDNTADMDKPVSTAMATALSGKQTTLVSGTNIKTINGASLLGSGDIAISSSNIGNSDLIISSAQRTLKLYGNTGSEYFSILNLAGATTFKISGNGDNSMGSSASVSLSLNAASGYSYPTFNLNGQGNTERAGLRQTNNRLAILHTNSNTVSATFTTTGLAIGWGDIGATCRLDVKAVDGTSNLIHRVRNSIDTLNFFQIAGDGTFYLSTGGGTLTDAFSRLSDGRLFMAKSGGNFIELNPGTTGNRLYAPSNGWQIEGSLTVTSTTAMYWYQGTFQVGGLVATGGATNALWISTGTSPSTNYADRHWYFSKDIVAGNAAAHFKSENGDEQRIYSIGGWGTPTGTLTRSTYLTYTAPAISAIPTQAEVQAIADHLQILSEGHAAVVSDLKTGHQLFKA